VSECSGNLSDKENEIHLFLGDVSAKGGIERVTISLANALSSLYRVKIISLYKENLDVSFNINREVELIILSDGLEKSMYNRKMGLLKGAFFDVYYIIKKSRKLRNIINPETAVAISCDVKMTALIKKSGYEKIIAIEHFEYDVINSLLKKARIKLYKKISAVVSLTLEDESKYKWLPKDKHFVINNIVEDPVIILPPDARQNVVLAVGRLTHQKGFDLLLRAWEEIDSSDWQLLIVGDGEERTNLLNFIKEKSLKNANIIPFEKNIADYYNKAKVFVLSSRYEGLGMVLVEALSFGLACISFDCPAGPKSILNKNNGILVKANDVSALAIELEKLISNPDKIEQLNKIAPESIDDFRANTVLKQWKHLIDWVINEEI